MFQFSCRLAFSSFKLHSKNNANFDAVSSKRANFDEVQFLKHLPKLKMFGTHNQQTLRHNKTAV